MGLHTRRLTASAAVLVLLGSGIAHGQAVPADALDIRPHHAAISVPDLEASVFVRDNAGNAFELIQYTTP